MLSPRWKKVLSDLWSNKARTLLVAMSIAVGVFAVGSVSGMYFILKEDVAADYLSANPHSGIMYTDQFDDDFLVLMSRVDGVKDVEGRSAVSGQINLANGDEVTINVTSTSGIAQTKIDQLELEGGSSDLREKEIYIERGARTALGLEPGDIASIEMDGGRVRKVRVAGYVHDVTANAFTLARQVYAYATPATMAWLGGADQYNQVLFTVKENPLDEAHIREVAKGLDEVIRRSGREVYINIIFRPGQHPAQSTLDAIFAMMGGMGVLALFLSAFLVINTIIALLSQQIRNIGVMKAIGATMGQIASMYLVLILAFGVVALLLAIPISALVSYASVLGLGQLLNIDMGRFRIPNQTLILEIIVGLGVPLFAGLVPVFNGARQTVREAMSSYGLSTLGARSLFDRMLENVRGLPRPLLLSLRNTFRRKARLALTLFTLMLGGAIFIAVFNLQASLYRAIEVTLGYVLSDVNVTFQRNYRIERVRDVVERVPGVVSIEGWGDIIGQSMRSDGKTSDQVELVAPPAGSQLIKPVLTAGRWLVPGDENAVVVGNHFVKMRPDIGVGDTVNIQIDQKDYSFQVVGVFEMAGTVLMPIVYVNNEYLTALMNDPGQVYTLRIVTDRHDAARQNEVAKALSEQFEQEGFKVGMTLTGDTVVQQNRITIDILVYLLLFMAVLIAIVGGLGLMGTMSMNVMERTREIGVMRSIGAVNGAIMRLVIVEGMIIGLISWGLGALLSIPIAKGLGWILGVALLNVPLQYQFSLQGLVIWIIVVVMLSALSCVIPARNAVRLTVRDVLAYE